MSTHRRVFCMFLGFLLAVLGYGADVRQLKQDDEYLTAFSGVPLREVARSRIGLNIGYLSPTHSCTFLIDLLESRGYLKMLMNPTFEVVNSKTANVSYIQKVVLNRMTMRSTQSDYLETKTEYEDVIDSLGITPHVYADGYIGLETTIVLGSKNIPEGVKQIPIITRKEFTNKENRIRRGERFAAKKHTPCHRTVKDGRASCVSNYEG